MVLLRWQVFHAIIGRQKHHGARNCGGSEQEKAARQKLEPPEAGTGTMAEGCVCWKPPPGDGEANEGRGMNFGVECIAEFSLARL